MQIFQKNEKIIRKKRNVFETKKKKIQKNSTYLPIYGLKFSRQLLM